MIKSMTGFGRCEEIINGIDISIEIKSVNHRYFEFSSRVSRGFGFIEDKIKKYLQSRVARGKVDVFVSINTTQNSTDEIVINHSLIEGYVKAYNEIATTHEVRNDVSVGNILRFPDILTIKKQELDEDEMWQSVLSVLEKACDNFVNMRTREGENMYNDLTFRVKNILADVEVVEQLSPETVKAYCDRLYAKLSELLEDRAIEEQRVLTEAAIFADKVAVDEETVRLKSHFVEFMNLINGDGGVGRKLDFIVQEMNREINTIGSKSNNAQIAKLVINMKSEVEKIREQIQNIE